MMRTTRCLFALGFGVSLAAACGDDDSTISPTGGTGGRGGSAGTAGRGGAGGTAGTGGTAGMGGSSAGTGGSSAGTGGSSAGTGGSSAGTGGSGVVEPPDAGPDAASDAGEVPDGGPQPTACPEDLEAASEDADTSEGTQQVIITRLVFVGTEIEVTFRAVNGDFDFGDPLQLCTGSEDTDCDADVQDVVGTGDGGVLTEGEEVTYSTPIGDIVTAASGEIALVNGLPDDEPDEPIIRAYVNWGDYTSLPPENGDNDDLETEAIEEGGGLWTEGDSVEVGIDTTIYATDDVTGADGFEVCTQEP